MNDEYVETRIQQLERELSLVRLELAALPQGQKTISSSDHNNRHLEQLVQELPAGVYSCNLDGEIDFYNNSIVQLWGRKPEAGERHWCCSCKIFTLDRLPVSAGTLPAALAITERRSITGSELILERPDGTKSNVLVYAQPQFDSSKEITGAINMVFDISELAKARKSVEDSEERFRYLVEQTLSPICIFKGENMILEVANDSVFKIWHVGKDTLGKAFLDIVPEMKDQPFSDLLIDVFHNGVTHHGSEWPAYFIREDGTKEDLFFNFVFQPYRERDKTISGVFVFANDVTELVAAKNKNMEDQESRNRELEEKVQQRTLELSEVNVELQRKNKELESFNYISSHDLQEPLRKIQTFASRILENEYASLADKVKSDFSAIQNAAGRMQLLIEDLLAYSRTTVNERKLEATDLTETVHETIHELATCIEEKHATIEVGSLCRVNINRFQFRQVIANLLGNSLKFSHPGIPPHVTIKSETMDGSQLHNLYSHQLASRISLAKTYCCISFSDNGIGFDPAYKELIFDVFQRLYGKDEYPGTGIGLAIVKKIVENHDGVVIASSEHGSGARFDIIIPA